MGAPIPDYALDSETVRERNERIAQEEAEIAEHIRVKRWQATYNAALTGIYGLRCPVIVQEAHEAAVAAANVAHGELHA
jgi:hypothetical protein